MGQQSNPYLQLLQHIQSQQQQQSPNQNMGAMSAMMSQPGGAPVGQPSGLPGVSAQQPDIQDAALAGQNPGITKQLLGAMGQLHAAITQMTDPEAIRIVRSIIVLLNNLIVRDQEMQNGQTGRFSAGQQGQGQGYPNPTA